MNANKKILFALLFFSLLGLLSATYLADLHFQKESSDTICDINSKISCTNLAQSKYSSIGPIPIAVLGILGYLTFLALTIAIFFKPSNSTLIKSIYSIASIAVTFTFYLIFIEFKVGIFCLGCLVSQTSTLAIFILSYLLYKKAFN